MKKLIALCIPLLSCGMLLSGCESGTNPNGNSGQGHAHNWGEVTYVWSNDNANCTATRVCLLDETHVETETATAEIYIRSYPGCMTDGEATATVIFENSAFLKQSKTYTIAATDHNWSVTTYDWSNDYSECTATRICLNDESHVETETVSSVYEIAEEATDEKDGRATYTATFTEHTDFRTQVHTEYFKYNGQYPLFDDYHGTVKYGLYPQRNVNDTDLLDQLNALAEDDALENGWYLLNGKYYVKVVATPFDTLHPDNNKFDNGDIFTNGNTYWFACEPINWHVVDENYGELTLVSSVLLDKHVFCENPSSLYQYSYSDIRTWLNGDFYNNAFLLDNSRIITTEVDNSAASTYSTSNPYASNNTRDKVFMLSYQDTMKEIYGFRKSTSDAARRCLTTDYLRAIGASFYTGSSYLYTGAYWTRSPSANKASLGYQALTCDSSGANTNQTIYNNLGTSVRPCITISIKNEWNTTWSGGFKELFNAREEKEFNYVEAHVKDDDFMISFDYTSSKKLENGEWILDEGDDFTLMEGAILTGEDLINNWANGELAENTFFYYNKTSKTYRVFYRNVIDGENYTILIVTYNEYFYATHLTYRKMQTNLSNSLKYLYNHIDNISEYTFNWEIR